MTYNFDPDKWYDIERGYLEARLKSGKITKEDFNRAIEELERYLAAPGLWSIEGLLPNPTLDPIRDDPRFQALVERYGRD